jgi:hypothetical protein
MGIPDGAHTHGHGGGSGLGTAVLVLFGAALAVKAAPAVLGAAAELLHVVLIAAAVILGLAGAGVAALVAVRVRRGLQETPRAMHHITPAPPKPSPLPSEPPPAIEAPRQLHVHFHGVDAADVAAIIRRQQENQ